MKLSVFNPLCHLACSALPQLGVAAEHWVLTCMNPFLPVSQLNYLFCFKGLSQKARPFKSLLMLFIGIHVTSFQIQIHSGQRDG